MPDTAEQSSTLAHRCTHLRPRLDKVKLLVGKLWTLSVLRVTQPHRWARLTARRSPIYKQRWSKRRGQLAPLLNTWACSKMEFCFTAFHLYSLMAALSECICYRHIYKYMYNLLSCLVCTSHLADDKQRRPSLLHHRISSWLVGVRPFRLSGWPTTRACWLSTKSYRLSAETRSSTSVNLAHQKQFKQQAFAIRFQPMPDPLAHPQTRPAIQECE